MEIESFLFDAPKTCFNSVTGKKIAHNVVGLVLFRNQWCYCLFDDDEDMLLDEKGVKVVGNVKLLDAENSAYLIANDDDTQSLLAKDGRVLFDKVRNIVFSSTGWFVVVDQNDKKKFYRPDFSLAVEDFLRYGVIDDDEKELFFVENEPDKITLYQTDGTVFASNVKKFQFMSPTFYLLTMDDKTVVFDNEKNTEFVCSDALPQLTFGNMVKTVGNDGCMHLYRADGTLLLSGHRDYFGFDNGMILVVYDDGFPVLFNSHLETITDKIVDTEGGINGQFLKISTGCVDYLFDDEGQLLHAADCILPCGHNYFLSKDKGNDVGVLYYPNGVIKEKGVVDAFVFDNGWMLLKKAAMAVKGDCYFVLKTSDDEFVTSSPYGIEYLPQYNVWISQKEKNRYALYHEMCGEVIDNIDKIINVGALVLARIGNIVDIYSLTDLNEMIAQGSEKIENCWKSIWHGSLHELKSNVTFCSGACIGGAADFLDIFDDECDSVSEKNEDVPVADVVVAH